MDKELEKKSEGLMDNILTMAGVACLMYPLIKQATKTLLPELEKLSSAEAIQEIKMLPSAHDKHEDSDKAEHDKREKTRDDEIEELKRKLLEYESKEEDRQQQ